MGLLTALVLATPLFGLSLTPPSLGALPLSAAPATAEVVPAELPAMAALASAELSALALSSAASASHGVPSVASASPAYASLALVGDDDASGVKPTSKEQYRLQLRKRAKLTKIHRMLGITTWALTGLAVIAGTIQWRNLYAGKSLEDTPCVQGNAWLGQRQCYGTPWFHALTGFGAGAAYFSTFGIALAMPDPDDAAKGDSAYAKTLRTHKILRWVHLGGMVAQMVLGIVIANPKLSGDIDRAGDYGKLRALSLIHLTSGWITLGALSWAGTIMLI